MSPLSFAFGAFESSAYISRELPGIDKIAQDMAHNIPGAADFKALLVCDEHTAAIADSICRRGGMAANALPRCTLASGEAAKNWTAVEAVLRSAKEAGLGRDAVFIGIGGGVVGDLTAFAASVYMRGCGLALVSTTLLGMVDAGLGGKSGFDLFGIKNLAGAFYPARYVYMPLESLATLPPAEWKSGMAELIKTAVLAGNGLLGELAGMAADFSSCSAEQFLAGGSLERCIQSAVQYKGSIVEADPQEKTGKRALLNLGHTFGHTLEASAGLGAVSHGEAVAWGMVRACELGRSLGITPQSRAEQITAIISAFGYECAAPHPLMKNEADFFTALGSDKKKKDGRPVFIVPDANAACQLTISTEAEMSIIRDIIRGETTK